MFTGRFVAAGWLTALLSLGLLLAPIANAQTTGAIQVAIEESPANPGDTVEVGVRLTASDVPPAVIVLFIAYNPAKLTPFEDFYEFVLRDLAGNPQRDNEGNAIVRRSAVRPEAALEDAGKVADVAFHPAEGVVGISMAGLNAQSIGNGLLFTLAFQVEDAAGANERIVLRGVEEVDPVILADTPTFSTAAANEFDQDNTRLNVVISDGAVQMGCFPVAAVPEGLTATMDRADEVLLSWDQAANSTEYRVFRSRTNNLSNAQALGSGWTTETTFSDVSALQPEILDAGGCFRDPTFEPVRYFYWVKARSVGGCESDGFSAPAEGFRTGAKSWTSQSASTSPGARGASVLLMLALGTLVVTRFSKRPLRN